MRSLFSFYGRLIICYKKHAFLVKSYTFYVIIRVLYGNRVFKNKKDKISSLKKILTKVVRNVGNENAGI